MKTPETCKVALIGAGNMAREHLRAFKDVPGVVLSGIYSRTRSRAESLAVEFGVEVVCDSIEELYDRTHADLVVVTVTEPAMNVVSQACFDFSWTVFLEKPAGYNVPDAESILNAARANARRVFVALNRRFLSSTRTVLADLDRLEGTRFIKVQDQEDPMTAYALTTGEPELMKTNWMYVNAVHIIDFLRVFGRGKVVHVEPVVAWNPEKPGIVISRIDFESGDTGLYEGIWDGPGPWAVSVSLPSKRWELRPVEQAAFQLRGERRFQGVDSHVWEQSFKPGFRLQAEMAVASALGKTTDLPTIEDGFETMLLINQIFKI